MRTRSAHLAATSAAALAFAFTSPFASAGTTSQVKVETYKDFDEGEADSAFITSLGEVKPGWSTNKQDLTFEGGVWAALAHSSGTTLIGTADNGKIFIAKSGSVSEFATIPDVIAVVSLAEGANGTVYAGTMPGGQIWRINPGSGKTSKVATLKDAETVWALGVSGDRIYAGVGPVGKLFEVTPKTGASKVVFESDDKRVMSIATTDDGAVWFGTSEKALLYRYDPKRRVTRAMADFAGNEVTAIAAYRGGVVATANDLTEPSTSGTKTKEAIDKATKSKDGGEKAKEPDAGSKPGADKATPSTALAPRKGGRKGKGALFYVRGDGSLEQLHALTQTYFTSVVVNENEQIFAGAADKGRIYMVDSDDSVSTAFDVEQRAVSKVIYQKKGRGLAFTTDDAAALYRADGKAKKATYTSKVFDLKAPSRFGRFVWRGSSTLSIETRTGNTSEPGKGWSGWSKPKTTSRGGGGASGGKISSPVGRYTQFRVTFGNGKGQVLRAATLYYLPQNRPTKIESIEIKPSEKRSAMATADSGALKPRSPELKVSWKVENPDSDASIYELEVRREGEARWRKLPTGNKPLTTNSYKWNTETFPDGFYRLRVTASDRGANASSRARISHHTTELFAVDNTKPRIDGLTVRYPSATARSVDAMNPITEMAFSIDDQPWIVGTTRDGLFDDLAEMLELELPSDLRPGLHTLAIRVADAAGNIGSASISFRTK